MAPVTGADGSAVREAEPAADGVGDPTLGLRFSIPMSLWRFTGRITGGVTPLVFLLSYRPGTKPSATMLGKTHVDQC